MESQTHTRIDPRLVGEIVEIAEGSATVRLLTLPQMAVDEQGLVHGGFVFGLADYAAMLAVNDPNVVLGSAEVRFVAPVRLGATVLAHAEVQATDRRRRQVTVRCEVDGNEVLVGTFQAFVLDRHVLG